MDWLFLLILAGCGIDAQNREDPSPTTSNGTIVENGTIAIALAETEAYTDISGYLVGFEATHPATESAAGGYEIANLFPDTYDLIVLGKNPEGTDVGIRINAVRVSSGRTISLSGIQLSALGSVPGNAKLQDSPTKSGGIAVQISGTSYQAITDAAGNYQIPSVPAGTHKVMLKKSGYFPGSLDQVEVPVGAVAAMPNFEMVPRNGDAANTYLRINGGAKDADSRTVDVTIAAPEYVTQMLLSENSRFTGITPVPFASQAEFQFSSSGARTLYVRLLDRRGATRLSTLSADIFIDLQSWEKGTVVGLRSFSAPAVARSGNFILLWQGGIGDLCRIEGAAVACSPLPELSALEARTDLSLLGLPGERFIVYGGRQGASDRYGGAVFEVSGATWQPVALSSVPLPRFDYAAAAVGNHFFYWGGAMGSAPVSSGAVYDTIAERWQDTNYATAPLARAKAIAVPLDGDRVWVWGGSTKPGGIYSIGSRQWTRIEQTGAPSPRIGSSAVLVDNKVFVWGGRGLTTSAPLADGGMYDLAADTWQEISASGAPSARAFHTTIVADSSVVIWGGETDPGSPLAGGAIYNPATDTWATISAADAPAARSQALGFWTGSAVGLFGGSTDGNSWSDEFYLFSPGE